MAIVSIVRPPGRYGASLELDGALVFRFDATISEQHGRSATPTAHPVETGADLVDHVRIEPRRLVLVGIRTAVPFAEVERIPNRDRIAWEALDAILGRGRPLVVTTSLGTFSNMVLADLDVRRDATTGQALVAALTFSEIRLATAREVEIPPELVAEFLRDGATSEVDGGRQPTDPASVAETEVASSWAAQALDAFGG
jgi:hypothetical protein